MKFTMNFGRFHVLYYWSKTNWPADLHILKTFKLLEALVKFPLRGSVRSFMSAGVMIHWVSLCWGCLLVCWQEKCFHWVYRVPGSYTPRPASSCYITWESFLSICIWVVDCFAVTSFNIFKWISCQILSFLFFFKFYFVLVRTHTWLLNAGIMLLSGSLELHLFP